MKTTPPSAAAPPDATEVQSRVRDLHRRLASVLDRGAVAPSYQLPKEGARAVHSPLVRDIGRFIRRTLGLR